MRDIQIVELICGVCGAKRDANIEYCAICLKNFQNRKPVNGMTPDEKKTRDN